METPLTKIKSLIQYLPDKDIPFANKFIETRKFEDLRDLVKSDIIKYRAKQKPSNDFELDEVIEGLEALFAEVNNYCILLGCDEEEDGDLSEDEITSNLLSSLEELNYGEL